MALLAVVPAALAQLPADLRGKAQVFTYEGAPTAVAVEKDSILLNYVWSRVTLDRATLAVKSRLTRAEGFRDGATNGVKMLRDYPQPGHPVLVGPGIALTWAGVGGPRPRMLPWPKPQSAARHGG